MKLVIFALACSLMGHCEELTVWIEPCKAADVCESGDTDLASWALRAWSEASERALTFRASPEEKARLRIYWARPEGGRYGEARPIQVDGVRGAAVYVRTGPAAGDSLRRDVIAYLTCLHELGHALGLPHTRSFADIMYNFQYGGDIDEYFGRYLRRLQKRGDIAQQPGLSTEDIRKIRELWASNK